MSRFESYLGNNWCAEAIVLKYQEYIRIPYVPKDMVWLQDGHIEDSTKSAEWNREFVEKNHKKWVKERNALTKKRKTMWAEIQEMIRFDMWDTLDRKLTDGDIDRLFEKYFDKYESDSFDYMLSMISNELNDIRSMDWFKDKPDYNYV